MTSLLWERRPLPCARVEGYTRFEFHLRFWRERLYCYPFLKNHVPGWCAGKGRFTNASDVARQSIFNNSGREEDTANRLINRSLSTSIEAAA